MTHYDPPAILNIGIQFAPNPGFASTLPFWTTNENPMSPHCQPPHPPAQPARNVHSETLELGSTHRSLGKPCLQPNLALTTTAHRQPAASSHLPTGVVLTAAFRQPADRSPHDKTPCIKCINTQVSFCHKYKCANGLSRNMLMQKNHSTCITSTSATPSRLNRRDSTPLLTFDTSNRIHPPPRDCSQ